MNESKSVTRNYPNKWTTHQKCNGYGHANKDPNGNGNAFMVFFWEISNLFYDTYLILLLNHLIVYRWKMLFQTYLKRFKPIENNRLVIKKCTQLNIFGANL